MPDREKILNILSDQRSTATGIAEKLELNAAAVYSILKAEEADGNVEAKPVIPGANWQLVTWKITESGISLLKS